MKTGIESLDTGAPDITYEGNQGPKSPQEDQRMMQEFQMAQLQEEYEKHVFEMQEQGLEPMSMEQFTDQVMSEGQMSSNQKGIEGMMQDPRTMAANGGVMQLVKEKEDGSRPGYRGSDYGDEARGTGAYSSNPNFSGGNANTGSVSQGNQGGGSNTGGGSTVDRSSALQTFNTQKATGQIDKDAVFTGPLNDREKDLIAFKNKKPKVNIPNFGLSGMFLNLFNKGINSPIQKFADFSAGKNRAFFEDVIRAGKIPGLDFGTVADMTPEQLENSYGSYMDNRMSGATDAYGNPIGDQGGGITNLVDYNTFNNVDGNIEDENIEVASDPFTSRFLQNQPEDIRAEIESRMQNYYTV